MRRIASKDEQEKKRRRNGIIVSLILVFVMLFSILGYAFQREDNSSSASAGSITYHGFQFTKSNNFWILQEGSFQFGFTHSPLESNESYSGINGLDNYYNQPLYIYTEDDVAGAEIYRNLYPKYNSIVLRLSPACIENKTCTGDYPIKTCQDNLIVIKEAESDNITQQDNCVFIEGKKEDLTRLTDEFLFYVLRIKQ